MRARTTTTTNTRVATTEAALSETATAAAVDGEGATTPVGEAAEVREAADVEDGEATLMGGHDIDLEHHNNALFSSLIRL
jgi:hypothetical protein